MHISPLFFPPIRRLDRFFTALSWMATVLRYGQQTAASEFH